MNATTPFAEATSTPQPKRTLPPPPPALARLLARVPKTARGDLSISSAENDLAKQIQAFGPIAAPYVLALLDSAEPAIRIFAGYVVRDLKGLTANDLDLLLRAYDEGGADWSPPAIGRIGTPRAIEFLIGELKKKPMGGTQITYALKVAGAPAAAPLVRAFGEDAPVTRMRASAICEVLGEMKKEAAPAVPVLVARAQDTRGPRENRLGAIRALGCIGSPARAAARALAALSADSDLRPTVNAVRKSLGGPDAVAVLAEEIRAKPDPDDLRSVAAMGPSARAAVPAVLSALRSESPRVRVYAARALGFLGDARAGVPLIALLDDDVDFRLPLVAAQSLARLGIKAALPALDNLAKAHWFPPVREAAAEAATSIRGGAPPPMLTERRVALEFDSFEGVEGPRVSTPPPLVPGPGELTPRELNALSYDTEIWSYGAQGEQRTPTNQQPQAGVKTSDGFLVGASRGEWGGELVYIEPTHGGATRLLGGNVVGVHRTSVGIVVVTVAHFFSYGELFLAKPVAPGKYEVKVWRILPGAPDRSGMLPDGSLFIGTRHGDVVLRGDHLEVAPGAL